jgi:hypothetical protein
MDLQYEGEEETVIKSFVRPYNSNFHTFLFSFHGHMR